MRFSVVLDAAAVVSAFHSALQRPAGVRGDFYDEIRRSFKEEFCLRLEAAGLAVKRTVTLGKGTRGSKTGFRVVPVGNLKRSNTWQTDVEYCLRYGHDRYSLTAVCESRLDNTLPSLRAFHDNDTFNLGNIAVCVENVDADIDVTVDSSIELTGFAYTIARRNRKSYVILLGVQIRREALEGIFDAYLSQCDCAADDLDEIKVGFRYHYPPIFICRRCGKVHTCSCFEGHFDIDDDILRFLKFGRSWSRVNGSLVTPADPLETVIRAIQIRDGLCALCSDRQPKSRDSYCRLYERRRYGKVDVLPPDVYRGIDNEVRARFGYPLVGQRWLSETLLFKLVERMFSPLEVVHHYRGPELERLEIDIWIPELKLAIEYQGEQHFAEIAHWGGADGLARRRDNDRRKKALCKQLGYHLVEFLHTEELTEAQCLDKLAPYVPPTAV